MARKTITIDDKALNKRIERALKKNPQETVKAVNECLLHLSAESAKRAPIESGDLRNNCHADLNGIVIFANQQTTGAAPGPATKAFGDVGYSLPYALRQHEELGYAHDRTDGHRLSDGRTVNMVAGGQAKFLEQPFDENTNRYIKRIEQIPERTMK